MVVDDEIDYLELINKYKKEIISRYDDNFVLNYFVIDFIGAQPSPLFYGLPIPTITAEGSDRDHMAHKA